MFEARQIGSKNDAVSLAMKATTWVKETTERRVWEGIVRVILEGSRDIGETAPGVGTLGREERRMGEEDRATKIRRFQ